MGLNLRVHGLNLTFDSAPILDGVNFSLQDGDMVALLGPNGAGKTTLMRCISRALEPAKGTVFLSGRDIVNLNPREIARQMAVVPQDTGIDFDFTVEEVIRMGRYPHENGFRKNQTDHESIVRSSMELTGISHLRHRSAAILSGGERQRMVIARALCQQPGILLLDEPTSNLDIGYQWGMLDIVLRLNRKEKVTVIAAIHDLNLATLFFRRFILLARGKILAIGSAEEVLTEENILASYGVQASLFRHPIHGCLQVSVGKDSVSTMPQKVRDGKSSVHVIGGGLEALPVLEALWKKGYSLSLGPVSREDSGYRFARFYGFPVIENPPFSSISEEIYKEHILLMQESRWVVLPPIPFGEGNIRNLEAVVEAMSQGVPAIVFGEEVEKRDFTGGKVAGIMKRLKENGALFVSNVEEALARMTETERDIRQSEDQLSRAT